MANSVEKPWENIPLKDIQPYPLNYTQIVLVSYIFTAIFVSTALINYIFIPIYELDLSSFLLILLSPILFYGIIAFVLLYLNAQGNHKLMLKYFIEGMKWVIPLFLILILINKFLIMGFAEGLNLIPDIIISIILFFDFLFIFIVIMQGPLSLIDTYHPQARLHGIINLVLIFVVMIATWRF